MNRVLVVIVIWIMIISWGISCTTIRPTDPKRSDEPLKPMANQEMKKIKLPLITCRIIIPEETLEEILLDEKLLNSYLDKAIAAIHLQVRREIKKIQPAVKGIRIDQKIMGYLYAKGKVTESLIINLGLLITVYWSPDDNKPSDLPPLSKKTPTPTPTPLKDQNSPNLLIRTAWDFF